MSALHLISHRMLVSSLPQEAPQERHSGSPGVEAPLQVLSERDLSEIMDRDEEAFYRAKSSARPLNGETPARD